MGLSHSVKAFWRSHESMLRSAGLLLLFTIASNATFFGFLIAMGRMLGPADYGRLGAILALLNLVALPLGAIQTTVAYHVSRNLSEPQSADAVLAAVRAFLLRASVATVILCVLLGFWIARALEVGWPVIGLLAVCLVCILLSPLQVGILQGRKSFTPYGLVQLIAGSSRLVIGPVLVMLGLSVMGAVAAIALGYGASLAYASRKAGGWSKQRRGAASEVLRYAMPALLSLLALALFANVDVLVAKLFFDEASAGTYAAASGLAKIILLFPSAVGILLFPVAAERAARGESARGVLVVSILMLLVLGGGTAAIMASVPGMIVRLTFGPDFGASATILQILAASAVAISLINLLATYFLAINRVGLGMAVLLPAASLTLALLVFHPSLVAVATVLLAASTATFVIAGAIAVSLKVGPQGTLSAPGAT